MITKQEWLDQSDGEKNVWLQKHLVKIPYACEGTTCDLCNLNKLNWNGFKMIIEKFESYKLTSATNWCQFFGKKDVNLEYWGDAKTPWEAAALAYGEMKGLIV